VVPDCRLVGVVSVRRSMAEAVCGGGGVSGAKLVDAPTAYESIEEPVTDRLCLVVHLCTDEEYAR
jgi:hypothetical protein